MIVVVASQVDECAKRFAASLAGTAVLLTCRDLSTPGWRIAGFAPWRGAIVAGGRRIDGRSIRGVLTLLPYIIPQELVHIVPDDRLYVASEMTAFLRYWLCGLRCPVMNRPCGTCLSGPAWRREHWLSLAAGLSIPVVGVRLSSRKPRRSRSMRGGIRPVTVVGWRCFGGSEFARRQTAELARAAGVDLLQASFTYGDGPERLVDVQTFPDVSEPPVVDAVADYFAAGGT